MAKYKKNILHVVNIFFVLPYFIGDQFLYFKKKEYALNVICSPSQYLSDYAKKMKFNYLEVEIVRSINLIKDIHAIIKICLYIKKNKIDIVVGHTPKGALLAMLASWIMRVPHRIYFRHGLVYETMKGFKRKIMINIDRLTAWCATKVVCVSASLSIESIRDNLNPQNKQLILGKGTCGGIDALRKFNPDEINIIKRNQIRNYLNIDEDSYVIGFCGRLVKDKGIIELVEAFDHIKSLSKQKLVLLLVGDFENRDSLPQHIIEKLKNDKDIIVTGFIFEDIQYYYSLMDTYILPSYREGFPTSVLEASAMKIPVLTTKVTGCIDSIIEGYTGLYVSHTKESISDKINFLMNNKDSIKYGLNGRKFVLDHFDNQILWPIIDQQLYQ